MADEVTFLSVEDIKAAADFKTAVVHVPEWGGSVTVKSLTGTERDNFEASILKETKGKLKPNLQGARAKLVVAACIAPDGRKLFTAEDVRWLTNKSAAALSRVYDAAAALSGLSDDDLEEMLGNSDGDPSDGSTSG